MKFQVKVMPREVLLDTQGRAIEQSLREHKMKIQSVRVGKCIELEIPIDNPVEAESEARRVTEFLLINPLIEHYQLSRL